MGATQLLLLQLLGIIGITSGILCLVLMVDLLRTASKLRSEENNN